jgi:hypothetical protein
MLWKIVQIGVFFAVFASSIHYGWGSEISGLAVGVIAVFAAFVVTAGSYAIYDLAIRAKSFLLRRH